MGKPTPGFDLQVIDESGNIVPDEVEGDIAVRVVPERPACSRDTGRTRKRPSPP
jgi:acetyl-CoA synthetase/medium-chain acyl-CoA synthetase